MFNLNKENLFFMDVFGYELQIRRAKKNDYVHHSHNGKVETMKH